jgi:hypothetical protein
MNKKRKHGFVRKKKKIRNGHTKKTKNEQKRKAPKSRPKRRFANGAVRKKQFRKSSSRV